jgi:ParB/RepB/Spo0J family partition protein
MGKNRKSPKASPAENIEAENTGNLEQTSSGSPRKRSPRAALLNDDRLRVVYRPISELILDPRNPRTHSRRQIKQIARSIKRFGYNVPVLIDANLKVIVGHGRVRACIELGWSEVPTICLEHLTEAQARAFMIADNKLTENSVGMTVFWPSSSRSCRSSTSTLSSKQLASKLAKSICASSLLVPSAVKTIRPMRCHQPDHR